MYADIFVDIPFAKTANLIVAVIIQCLHACDLFSEFSVDGHSYSANTTIKEIRTDAQVHYEVYLHVNLNYILYCMFVHNNVYIHKDGTYC